jgi:hypothetical protein
LWRLWRSMQPDQFSRWVTDTGSIPSITLAPIGARPDQFLLSMAFRPYGARPQSPSFPRDEGVDDLLFARTQAALADIVDGTGTPIWGAGEADRSRAEDACQASRILDRRKCIGRPARNEGGRQPIPDGRSQGRPRGRGSESRSSCDPPLAGLRALGGGHPTQAVRSLAGDCPAPTHLIHRQATRAGQLPQRLRVAPGKLSKFLEGKVAWHGGNSYR